MKFKVMMKDPDTLGDAINDAVKAEVAQISGLDEDERDSVQEERAERVRALCRKWFKYDEYLCVEIDTDAGTCVVVQQK